MIHLTPREKQVCGLLVRGFMNKEIAMSLGISDRTVEEHRAQVLAKHDVRNAVELTRVVYRIEA